MTEAICREISLRSDYLPAKELDTLYFGGGTPGILPLSDLDQILNTTGKYFQLNPINEVTLEVNPENITKENLAAWKQMGINRLSIGIQSLSDEELRWMNRSHNAAQSVQCVEQALAAGFDNLNLDLIFGSPFLSDEQWQQQLRWALNCGATHLSAYALTVEPQTPLHKKVKNGITPDVSDQKQAQQYTFLYQRAVEAGWDFYEISNLSKKGHRARHNSAYWAGKPYLGVGPSAHSYNTESRSWNLASIEGYIGAINDNRLPLTTEMLDTETRINEKVMTAIRTSEGLNTDEIASTDPDWLKNRKQIIAQMTQNNWITLEQGTLKLTLEGRLMADHISAELFY